MQVHCSLDLWFRLDLSLIISIFDFCVFEISFQLFFFLQYRAKLLYFDYGDIVVHQGEQPRGIHLIVSGMVRVSLQLNSQICVSAEIIHFSKLAEPIPSGVITDIYYVLTLDPQ